LVRFAIGVPNVRDYGRPRLLLELALQAEEAGWDGFFVWDHLVYHHRGDAVADPWMSIAAIAARTERLRLGIMVCALARRRPWKVAREVATLDQLSNGRVVFGAALGSLPQEEFAAFGEDPGDRVRAEKLDEGLDIIRGLWSGEPFAHRGRHYQVAETTFQPTPRQVPLPIWIGGRWPNTRPFRRAARFDGVFPTHQDVGLDQTMTPAQLTEIVQYTLMHRKQSGAFDVVMEGLSPADPAEAEAIIAPYTQIGLTWWVEKLGWFRGSVDEMRARIAAGPLDAMTRPL
jgi:alkanesulfonate monooxygenase SsuD/methylene tetrahydromethanopterin reductase-like flavin-dependent oxidoreductase (luciferase family)